MQILLIEDNALFRDAISLILSQLDENVGLTWATSGAEARAACRDRYDLDLIIMDLSLPDEDGLSLLPALRQQTITVPIVVVSANEATDRVQLALQAGAAGFIPKKTPGPELLAALNTVLAGEPYIPMTLG